MCDFFWTDNRTYNYDGVHTQLKSAVIHQPFVHIQYPTKKAILFKKLNFCMKTGIRGNGNKNKYSLAP